MMTPEMTGFHFAQPLWLWALLAPLALWWWPQAKQSLANRQRLERYADRHLLPHVVLGGDNAGKTRRRLLLWTALWGLGVLAMAGPRLGYTDVSVYRPGTNLVILFDLSGSMRTADVKPSRLARARQEVEDMLDRNPGIRIGLIGFASVAHVIAPITEDDETLRNLLPSLSTELVRWQGSRLSGALERARRLLSGQAPDSSNAVLLISDGDFAEPGLEEQVGTMEKAGIHLYVLGVGTPEGGRVPLSDGGWLRDAEGQEVVSHLDERGLSALARAGGGLYVRADYRDDDTRKLLERISAGGRPQALEKGSRRIWNERFYVPVVVMMLLLLGWFRRNRSVRG